jgi:hypothetical protein
LSSAKSFRWAVRLVFAGLLIELASFFGLTHPWGFMLFAVAGCTLLGAGIVLYFVSVLRRETPSG